MTAQTNVEKQRLFRERHRGAIRERDRAQYQVNPRKWLTHIRRVYGITVEEYDAISAKQDDRCAICRSADQRRLHVDHDHETGRVRGLLCAPCNRLLGQARDNVTTLRRAAAYLEATGA